MQNPWSRGYSELMIGYTRNSKFQCIDEFRAGTEHTPTEDEARFLASLERSMRKANLAGAFRDLEFRYWYSQEAYHDTAGLAIKCPVHRWDRVRRYCEAYITKHGLWSGTARYGSWCVRGDGPKDDCAVFLQTSCYNIGD